MKPVSELLNVLIGTDFEFLLDIFSDLIPFLVILDEDVEKEDWKSKLSKSINASFGYKKHPIHSIFKDILLKSIIIDSIKLNDAIREAFLYKITLFSPNCIDECPDEHGCCHSSYSINKLDYNRIIEENLIDPNSFIIKNEKIKLRTKRVGKIITCIALDLQTRGCLIHKYKPSTCTKYPIINSVNRWDPKMNCWVGKCAHFPGKKSWGTKVSPIIVEALRTLWIKAQLIWESKQNIIKNFETLSANHKMNKILNYILALRKSRYIVGKDKTFRILKKKFAEEDVLKIYNILLTNDIDKIS